MARLPSSAKPKRMSQMDHDDGHATEPRKKTKTIACDEALDLTSQPTRRSSRTNMGKGGQKSQLQNIERVQTERSRTSKLVAATAGEPVNPMAPVALDARAVPPNSFGDTSLADSDTQMHQSAYPPPLPTHQVSMDGRYGFKPPSTAAITAHRNVAALAPVGSTTAHFGFNTTPSRSGSAVPFSGNESTAPSRNGSAAPSSRGGSTVPSSRNASTGHVRSSSSQLLQRSRMSLTRTYSAYGSGEMEHQSHHPSNTPQPPPYDRRLDDEDEDFDDSQFHQERTNYQPGELSIDEASPDEDERVAEMSLRFTDPITNPVARRIENRDIDPVLLAESSGDSNNRVRASRDSPTEEAFDSGRDVVNEHHQRNRFPRPPEPSTLRNIRLQQQHSNSGGQHHAYRDNETPSTPSAAGARAQPTPGAASAPQIPLVPSQTADIPPGPLEGPATRLRAYPIGFRVLIERAKLIAQCNVAASVDPFITRSQFLEHRSNEFFTEALAETQTVPPGYWPQYKKELSVLIWEAMMTWRSTLKSKARELVPRFYQLGEGFTPAHNKAEAQALIRGSAFTFDGVDAEGSTNNMAAPALGALVISFFYNGPSSLAATFPDVFAGEVSQVTVCLAATALRAAIDEYTATGVREDRKFEYSGYSKIYVQFCAMQSTINANPKHAAKTQELRIQWATSADVPANDPGNIIAFEEDFQPVLD